MADFVSPIVDVCLCLWHIMANRAVLIRNLKENLVSLDAAMGRLKAVYEDVNQLVEREERVLLTTRTSEVVEWLHKVGRMEAKVSKILQEGKEEEQKKCLGSCCPNNCRSSYKVGKRVSKMLNEVNELKAEGHFDVVTRDLGRAPVNKKPMEKTVGLELMVEEVCRCIEDTDLQTIGLYGLGGVGKTTLLKKIYNEILDRSSLGFEAVIWVSVSKQPDLKKMLDAILRAVLPERRFQHDGGEEWSEELMAEKLYEILKEKTFVLLLDDIWERLDLVDQLGVPIEDMHQKGSKVVFTTRTLEICGLMEAQRKIKVECLTPEAALDLFRKKVGEDTLNSHRQISKLAETMAAECKGLPLALVTVGRAMASRKNPQEWVQAISILRNSPSEFPGMNDILLLLKFSFDRLQNTTLKSCFLYCCLFPEDYNIRKEQLIELWLGEGFLDELVDCYVYEFGGLSNVRKKGEYIIGSLKQTCLLESGESEEFVTMHQMIRDMALWECREKIKVYVRGGPQSTQAYGSISWCDTVERISVWDCIEIEDIFSDGRIKDSRLPANLRTWIYKATMMSSFPARIFLLMPALTVLDLSNNFLLDELPTEIGKLINLQYLNLSDTNIYGLPTELRKLKKLRCLLLDGLSYFSFPKEMISKFELLEVFSCFNSNSKEDLGYEVLFELENLQHISEISILISSHAFTKILRSPKLQQCLKKIKFFDCSIYSDHQKVSLSPSLLRIIQHLEFNSKYIKEVNISLETRSVRHWFVRHYYFDNLCRVVIESCSISDATWLIYAPRLQHLSLIDCEFLREVIGDTSGVAEIEENAELFSSLTTLHLDKLPALMSICQHAFPFPLLMKIKIEKCYRLKKLPFDSNSTKNSLKQICGERCWWDELQWEDEAIKQVFKSKFVEN